ncbi:MAG: MG2 domain-containing protein [Dongiaceae bacterium]
MASRLISLVFLLVAFSSATRAQDFPNLAASADRYLIDIQSRFTEERDLLAGQASRLDGVSAIERKEWTKAVNALEHAIALGADDFRSWIELSAALRATDRVGDAIAAAYSAWQAASETADRARALFALGRLLDQVDRAREAIQVFQAGLNLEWNQEIFDRMQVLTDATAFRLVGAVPQLDGEQASICLQFRNNLKDTKAVHYEDYVKLEPAAQPTFTVTGDTLCLHGLEFGARYDLNILAGLPSIDDERMESADSVAVAIGDRMPSVGFPGSTYVLPKVGSAGIPLISVNVDRAELHLLRVTDRNLVQQIQQGRLLRSLDGYERSQVSQDIGEELWTGELEIVSRKNLRVTTLVPIAEILKETKPGIYVLTAERPGEDPYGWNYRATQWFVISDLGLTTFSGADGAHVFARSLSTGQPIEGVDLRLYARNNDELASGVTDSSGIGSFDPGLLRGTGGRVATALMARAGDGDFTFIDLTRPAFDLSDRGVGGRPAPGAMDAFFYTDRGVYRPGETAQLIVLLRDNAGTAIDGMPLTTRIFRPDGVLASEQMFNADRGGGYHIPLPISDAALTGNWNVYAHIDPKGPAVGSTSFLVEDVVPARIEVKVKSSVDHLSIDSVAKIAVDARYFYGAPASGLPVKATMMVSRNDTPVAAYPDYTFTLADETVSARQFPLSDARTDDSGHAELDAVLENIPSTPQPLKATLNVEVLELGGRPVIEAIELPIDNQPILVGLKPLFPDGQVPNGVEAAFDVIATTSAGTPANVDKLRYQFVREDWDYQWYYNGGYWDYEIAIRDQPLSSGELALAAGVPGHIGAVVEWGRFRVEIFDPASGAAASYRFSSGWWTSPGSALTPDKLQITTDRELYNAGDTATAFIKAPFAGPMLVAIATDRVLETRMIDADPNGTEITIPVEAKWGAGAYLLATAYRPSGAGDAHGPGRAVGVAWLGLDPAARTLNVALSIPDVVLPRQTIDLPVLVTGRDDDDKAFLTVAAVDEGILQLTEFTTPDPRKFLFGKRRLGIEIRDLYGNLINGKDGDRGSVRSGGDASALARRGAPPVNIQMVALFSGIVELDAEGRASVPLVLPDFNGRLRLMAIAYDRDKVGMSDGALVVRDPVVVQTSMPRFLATGDQSELIVTLQNIAGASGSYQVNLAADGPVSITEGASSSHDLASGSGASVRVKLSAIGIGESLISLSVTGPGESRIDRQLKLGVRPPQLSIVERTSRRLEPGESLTLSQAALERFVAGSGELYASFSPKPNLDVPGLLRSLDRYPYGCLEQTTSRAMPLLYVGDVARLWQVTEENVSNATQSRVQQAIFRVSERQRFDGGFGMWRSDSTTETWLSAYAMEFLVRARQQGYSVSDLVLEQGLRWLDQYSQNFQQDDAEDLGARAYAHYVLARMNAGDLSSLRYLHDNWLKRMPTGLAAAQIGAALEMHGDRGRAAVTFKFAVDKVERERRALRDYGSALRDLAATLTLLLETKVASENPAPLLDRLVGLQFATEYLSTQEQAWLVMAAKAVADGNSDQMTLSIDGVVQEPNADSLDIRPAPIELQHGLSVSNAGSSPVWATATIMGAPIEDLPATSKGFSIVRKYFTLDGTEVSLDKIKQSDILVVVISGTADGHDNRQALVVDLLPAGFEIENARLADARTTEQIGWLSGLVATQYVEFRDDRFIAAFDLDWGQRNYKVAYLVRAVTPGRYRLPASQVEDMYLPENRARTAMGNVTVAPLP